MDASSGNVSIKVCVPSLLRDCAGNQTHFSLEACTLDEAIQVLLETYPLLRFHLYDEADRLRQHVLMYYNDQNISWLERLDVPLRPGDELRVLQNVSGG
ncbi:MAG: MoaD/ThiS family protein [Chloroflexi bacterium]|nr:MoaD/ThiS family protein [Chloroflexota bacterium]